VTSDGIVFFGLLIVSAMWVRKKVGNQLRAFGKDAASSISEVPDQVRDLLDASGYSVVNGPRKFPVIYDLDDRQVEQHMKMDGIVEKDSEQYVLVVESDSTSTRRTSYFWREEWHAFHTLFPELAGVLMINPVTKKMIKIQVES
jgi:hypothetical protein